MPKLTSTASTAGLGVLLAITACQMTGDRCGQSGGPRCPSRHAVHSRRLHKVMADLGHEVRSRWPQEIAEERAADARRDRERRFRDASRLAKALADAAGCIPDTISDAELSEADRVAFLVGARELRARAGELEASAAAGDLAPMQTALAAVKNTCTGCHDQFAELAGPIRFGPSGL